MLNKPKLKKFLTIFPISDTTWGLRGGSDELWRLKLRNEEAVNAIALLSYLNGTYSVEEITDLMAKKGVNADEVSTLMEQLQGASLIEEADTFGLSEEEEKAFSSQITFFFRDTPQTEEPNIRHDSARVELVLLGTGTWQELYDDS